MIKLDLKNKYLIINNTSIFFSYFIIFTIISKNYCFIK